MSMSQKAFVFDWERFQSELASILMSSLAGDESDSLIDFGNANLSSLSDPDVGHPLTSDWTNHLENGDIQEVADHVLTKFYNPLEDGGLGDLWLTLESSFGREQRLAMLGEPFGPVTNKFDPGRMGSYFQDEATTQRSLRVLESAGRPELTPFLSLLRKAVSVGKGVYVTF